MSQHFRAHASCRRASWSSTSTSVPTGSVGCAIRSYGSFLPGLRRRLGSGSDPLLEAGNRPSAW